MLFKSIGCFDFLNGFIFKFVFPMKPNYSGLVLFLQKLSYIFSRSMGSHFFNPHKYLRSLSHTHTHYFMSDPKDLWFSGIMFCRSIWKFGKNFFSQKYIFWHLKQFLVFDYKHQLYLQNLHIQKYSIYFKNLWLIAFFCSVYL